MDFAAACVLISSAARHMRTGLSAAILLPIACAAAPAASAAERGAMTVTVVEVKEKKACLDDVVKLTGRIVAHDEALVRPENEGYHVSKVLAEDGDVVTAGQKLLELTKTPWMSPQAPATAFVTASVPGILVAPRPVPIGVPVSARSDPLFRIIRDGKFDLVLDVPQALLGKIRSSQSVGIETLSGAQASGVVRNVAPDVDFVGQIGHARVEISTKRSLYIGMFATAAISLDHSCNNVRVPLSAMVFRPGSRPVPANAQKASNCPARPESPQRPVPIVFVVNGQRAEERPVEYGLFAGKDVEISCGLKPGDLVVVSAGTFLRDGDPVRPVFAEQAEAAR